MTIGENQPNEAVQPAPEQEITATPATVETETPEVETEEETPPKTFTQEELDRIVAKEKAKIERRLKREIAQTVQQPTQQPVSSEPVSPEQFETWEDYAEALADRKAQEKLWEREVQQRRTEIDTTYADREEEARSKYDDFEQVVYNPNLRITDAMAETVKESEIGPDIAYFLGSNPKEAERISRLSPLQQAREIGRIEAKITAEPPAKKTSSAPAPISPVNARQVTNPSYDTTDPRSVKTMSTSEWIEAERQRQLRKSQHNR